MPLLLLLPLLLCRCVSKQTKTRIFTSILTRCGIPPSFPKPSESWWNQSLIRNPMESHLLSPDERYRCLSRCVSSNQPALQSQIVFSSDTQLRWPPLYHHQGHSCSHSCSGLTPSHMLSHKPGLFLGQRGGEVEGWRGATATTDTSCWSGDPAMSVMIQ